MLRLGSFLLLLPLLDDNNLAGSPPDWQFPDLHFRVPLVAKSGIYPRDDALIRWRVDPRTLLATGMTSAVDMSSFRVVATGGGLAKEVPSVFQPVEPGEDGTGAGDLVWQMSGHIEPLERVPFAVYFDVAGPVPHPAPRYPPIPGAVTGRTNLVRNPGFEQVDSNNPTLPANWMIGKFGGGQGSIQVVPSPCHSGEKALKIKRAVGMVGCRQPHVSLRPNVLYRFGFWVRVEEWASEDNPRVRLLAPLRQGNGEPVAAQRAYFAVEEQPQPDRWMHIQKLGLFLNHSEVVTPPDTAYCDLRVEMADGDPGAVVIDDVEIVEVAPEDLTPPVTVEIGAVERAEARSHK